MYYNVGVQYPKPPVKISEERRSKKSPQSILALEMSNVKWQGWDAWA